jgi:hypothetical protein
LETQEVQGPTDETLLSVAVSPYLAGLQVEPEGFRKHFKSAAELRYFEETEAERGNFKVQDKFSLTRQGLAAPVEEISAHLAPLSEMANPERSLW